MIDFVIEARLKGYPSGGEGQEIKFDDGSLGFETISDGYRYLDRYNGFNPFMGSEQVFDIGGALLWGMHYFGQILPEGGDPKAIYAFLREALLLVSQAYPFRGPAAFEKRNFRYENDQHGSFDRFHGIERIYENEAKVYELYYHGGRIQTL